MRVGSSRLRPVEPNRLEGARFESAQVVLNQIKSTRMGSNQDASFRSSFEATQTHSESTRIHLESSRIGRSQSAVVTSIPMGSHRIASHRLRSTRSSSSWLRGLQSVPKPVEEGNPVEFTAIGPSQIRIDSESSRNCWGQLGSLRVEAPSPIGSIWVWLDGTRMMFSLHELEWSRFGSNRSNRFKSFRIGTKRLESARSDSSQLQSARINANQLMSNWLELA